ncbi:MAG: hypothetical protein IJC86_02125 [Clostridia bacterium]|nr:hypothetical protein [Clostridia bacterium]
MKRLLMNVVSLLLTVVMMCSSFVGVAAETVNMEDAGIESTTMSLEGAKNNVEDYYFSEDEWREEYPDGLYVVEYNSYGVSEGGTDPQNPQDIYLGIVVYRLGGADDSAELTYMINRISADDELYPNSMGVVEFAPQQTKATAKVEIKNDDVRKGDQLLMFALTEASLGTISDAASAVITITDDEPYVQSAVSLSTDVAVFDKSAGSVPLRVVRKNNDSDYCSLVIKTSKGTAKEGVDFEAVEKQIMFVPDQTEQTVWIPLVKSDEKYTDAKYFTVTMTDMKGCEAESETSVRINITNEMKSGGNEVTRIEASADLERSDEEALVTSATSVVNKNDTVNRKDLLLSAVGAVNGTAVQSVPKGDIVSVSESSVWTDVQTVTPDGYTQRYSSGSKWTANNEYTDANEDTVIVSQNTYDLNFYKSMAVAFKNKENLKNGKPNTVFGYMPNDSEYGIDGSHFSYIKSQLGSCSDDDFNWMKNNRAYILMNRYACNDDYSNDSPRSISLTDGNADRFIDTLGYEASRHLLFWMIYNVNNQGDDTHFMMRDTQLHRAVIPFRVFDAPGVEFSCTDSSVTIVMDGYEWIFEIQDNTKGGVGIADMYADEKADKYGFYVGSTVTVTFSPVAGTSAANMPTPETMKLVDENGNVHNVGALTKSGSFDLPLHTIMSKDPSTLQSNYGLTKTEADNHINNTLGADECINYQFAGKLKLQVTYSIHQGVAIDYANVPTLTSNYGDIESDAAHIERIRDGLRGIVTFYDDNGNDITPSNTDVNLEEKTMYYPEIEFSYLIVDPTYANHGYIVSTNLIDLDYQSLSTKTKLSWSDCAQVADKVIFRLYDDKTEYLIPQLHMQSTSVSTRTESGFESIYNLDHLADYLAFEAIYNDTSVNPDPVYYDMYFSISDIYTSAMKNGAPKDFKVKVYREKVSNTEKEVLFEFTYTGGVSVPEAKAIELVNLNKDFGVKQVDVEGAAPDKTDPFTPSLTLLSHSGGGYNYVMHIPTHFDYVSSESGQTSSYYNQIFFGGDGVSMELENYDRTTADSTQEETESREVISTMSVASTQYVGTQVLQFTTVAEPQGMETPYYDEQQEFDTYNYNNVLIGISGFDADFSNVAGALSQIYAFRANRHEDDEELNKKYKAKSKRAIQFSGTGLYANFNDNDIVIGGKFAWTYGVTGALYESEKKKTEGENTTETNTMVSQNGVTGGDSANKYSKRTSNPVSKLNSSLGKVSGGFSVDANVTISFNPVTQRYTFKMFKIGVGGNMGASARLPIPALANMVYFTVSSTVYASFSTGLKQVLDYVDQKGVCHYKSLWSGIPVTVGFTVAMGVGVGISGILAVEASASIDVNISVILGKNVYSPSQLEFDLNTKIPEEKQEENYEKYSYKVSYGDGWVTDNTTDEDGGTGGTVYTDYYFNDTKVVSEKAGDTITIEGQGTSFQLVGIRHENGGVMEVTVKDAKGSILRRSLIDTKSNTLQEYRTLFTWNVDNYTDSGVLPIKFTVTITHKESESADTTLMLDSFRVYNPQYYRNDYYPLDFNDFNFKIGTSIKVVLCVFDIVLEPAYMLINCTADKQTLTYGFVNYSETIDVTAKKAVRDIPVVMASSEVGTSNGEDDYFTTGEYSEEKTKTLIAEDIKNTAGSQVLEHNGSIYAFYSVVFKDETTGEARYELHYAVDGVEKGKVSDDIFVSEFYAFEDENGKLSVIYITTDSTVVSIKGEEGKTVTVELSDGTTITTDDISDLKNLLQKTCVKLAVLEDGNSFSVQNIGNTADSTNQRPESSPVAASITGESGNTSVLIYAEDEKTEEDADYNMNWQSFAEDEVGTSQKMASIMNAVYTGRAQLYCAVKSGGEAYSAPVSLDLESLLGADKFKTGFKITSIDAIMADQDTACVAFSAEIPYVADSVSVGTLKELYYITFDISGGNITSKDVLVIDSVIDYDAVLDEVFAAGDEIPESYINPDTGEIYDSMILRNVQLERAVVGGNDTVVDENSVPEPVLFYQTNSSINHVTYSALCAAVEGKKNGSENKEEIEVLYDGYFDDYVIAVEPNHTINLIYTDNTGNENEDTLYIANYDAEKKLWNYPRQLTYSDAFDADKYEDREETFSLAFEDYSAFIDSEGKVAVALKSSYAPFVYDKGITEDSLGTDSSVNFDEMCDGTYIDASGNAQPMIVTPVVDYDSEKARSDVFLLTFEKKVTDVNVTDFKLDNDIFSAGNEIGVFFNIENTGDTIIDKMRVKLYYYDLEKGEKVNGELTSQELTCTLLAGDYYEAYMSYVVEDAPDNSLLCVEIRDGSGRKVLYDSLHDSYEAGDEENVTYHEIHKSAEIIIDGMDLDIDSKGILTFNVRMANIGAVAAQHDATVYCDVHNAEGGKIGTLFSFVADKESLDLGESKTYSNYMDVSDYLVDGEMYYSLRVSTSDKQYNTENDVTEVTTCHQMPEIQVESITDSEGEDLVATVGGMGYMLRLGEEITVESSVLSDVYTHSQLRGYEIGSSCLSIDNSSQDGTMKIKAIAMPENASGCAKVIIGLEGTRVYRCIYLKVTKRDVVDFDSTCIDENWTESTRSCLYAYDADVAYTQQDSSEINFSFYGEDIKIYGNYLENGGKFLVTITDKDGNIVKEETVDTAKDLNDYGMLLYTSGKMEFDEYEVSIKSILQEGERLALDCAKFTVDLSDADLTPYAVAESYEEELALPLVSGRQRQAEFTLNFNKHIELKEGKSYEDITLRFDEYEKQTDGTYKPTGEQSVFTAVGIEDESRLVLSSVLSSKQGTVMKYVLADSYIPEGVLVTKRGKDVATEIPDWDMVSYELKESGILSVIVGDDAEMPDGSVQKSVLVKFMTAPVTDRLEGTKLLYLTKNEKGEEQTVEFKYSQMSEDPRTAVYRADKLELSAEELSKVWNFSSGIVLGESNYVLVTAQGDYLENDISTVIEDTSKLNISYEKIKSETAPVISVSEKGAVIVSVIFPEAVNSQYADNAYVTVRQTLTYKDGETRSTNIRLYAQKSNEAQREVVFTRSNAESLPGGVTAQYVLVSKSIEYKDENRSITRAYDGIAIDPAISKATDVTVLSDAYIVSAKPYIDAKGKLCAEVVFSTAVKEQNLAETTVSVTKNTEEYDSDHSKELALEFESLKNGRIATYKYKGDSEISLAYGESAKTYTVNNTLNSESGNKPVTADGAYEFSLSILSTEALSLTRAKATSATIELVKNADFGYNAVLSVKWNEDIARTEEGNTFATLSMTRGSSEPQNIGLDLIDLSDNTLKFVTTTPITLNSGEITTFEITDRFIDAQSLITDAQGVGVSEEIRGLASLVVDNTNVGVVKAVSAVFTEYGEGKISAEAKVVYDSELRERSFENSSIEATQKIIFPNGDSTSVSTKLLFDSIIDSNTALYKAELTVDEDAQGVELILGEEIKTYGDNSLYNTDKTLALSTELPDCDKVKLGRVQAKSVTMMSKTEDLKIESVADTVIAVTYNDEIVVEDMQDITLVAKLRGVEGTDTLVYRAHDMINDKTLLFVPDAKAEGKHANVIELYTESTSLILSNDAKIYDKENKFDVALLLPDSTQSFYLNTEDSTIPTTPDPSDGPMPTTPDSGEVTVPTAPDEEESIATKPEEDKTDAQIPTENTGAQSDSDTNGDKTDGSHVSTGRDLTYMWIMAAVMVGAFMAVIIWRKKFSA